MNQMKNKPHLARSARLADKTQSITNQMKNKSHRARSARSVKINPQQNPKLIEVENGEITTIELINDQIKDINEEIEDRNKRMNYGIETTEDNKKRKTIKEIINESNYKRKQSLPMNKKFREEKRHKYREKQQRQQYKK